MLYKYYLHIDMYAVTIFHSTLKWITRHTRITGTNVIFSGYTYLSRNPIFLIFSPIKLTFTSRGGQKAHFLLIRLSITQTGRCKFHLKKTPNMDVFSNSCAQFIETIISIMFIEIRNIYVCISVFQHWYISILNSSRHWYLFFSTNLVRMTVIIFFLFNDVICIQPTPNSTLTHGELIFSTYFICYPKLGAPHPYTWCPH